MRISLAELSAACAGPGCVLVPLAEVSRSTAPFGVNAGSSFASADFSGSRRGRQWIAIVVDRAPHSSCHGGIFFGGEIDGRHVTIMPQSCRRGAVTA